jgi:nicotinate-nucleotide adenylyltransferase
MVRPGVALQGAAELRQRLALPAGTPLELQVMETPLIDIASHDLRDRVTHGRSIRYCVPRAVEVYIHEKGLYRPATAAPV